MLKLPLTSTMLATLLLGADGLQVMPAVILAVVVSYVVPITPAVAPAEPQERASPRRRPQARRWPPRDRTRSQALVGLDLIEQLRRTRVDGASMDPRLPPGQIIPGFEVAVEPRIAQLTRIG
jgi:hypothetical protein